MPRQPPPKTGPGSPPRLKVGDYLYASCSAVLFARIVNMGPPGAAPTWCTIRLFDPSELDLPDTETLLTVNIERIYPADADDAHVDERGSWTGETVVLDTPGNGCLRCTSMFQVLDKPDLKSDFWGFYSPKAYAAARADAGLEPREIKNRWAK